SLATLVGCSERSASSGQAGEQPVELALAAYTTPREVYSRTILPAFSRAEQAAGRPAVTFRESYLASGAQARAVVGGFEADLVALSLEPDVARVCEAGLITPGWNDGARGGVVSRSVVVIGVRKGNPLGIRDWKDLARPGVEVLTPNVRAG